MQLYSAYTDNIMGFPDWIIFQLFLFIYYFLSNFFFYRMLWILSYKSGVSSKEGITVYPNVYRAKDYL